MSREGAGTGELSLFVEMPFDYENANAHAVRFELAPGLHGTFVGLADLIEMKRSAARPQDLQDIAGLKSLQEKEGGDA